MGSPIILLTIIATLIGLVIITAYSRKDETTVRVQQKAKERDRERAKKNKAPKKPQEMRKPLEFPRKGPVKPDPDKDDSNL